MKTMPISIIIPAYNASKTVDKIVTSILSQSFQNFELILVDDGSTDDTLKVLRGIKKRDPRIVIRSQKNKGPSGARNTGIEKITGRYVVFFDADDDIMPNTIERIVTTTEQLDSDLLVYGWQTKYRSLQQPITTAPQHASIQSDAIKPYVLRSIGNTNELYNLWNKVFRADIITRHNLRFREDTRFGEDLIFFFDYLRHTQRIDLIPDVLYHYNRGSETSVFNTSALDPNYRKMNDEKLNQLVGETRTREVDDLTQWIRWRWLLSYYSLLGNSRLPHDEKIRRAKAAKPLRIKVARDARFVGRGHLIAEHIISTLSRSPTTALLLGRLLNTTKWLLLRVGLV